MTPLVTKLSDLSTPPPTVNTPSVPDAPHFVLADRVQTKLDSTEINDSIRSKMCLVQSSTTKSSAFFINEHGLLLTTFHCFSEHADPSKLQVMYDGRKYSVGFPPSLNIPKARALDICLLQLQSPVQTSCFELLPPSIPFKEGIKTHFAGYPLSQSVITFHKGPVSSFYQANGIQYFTIDGTVVPGNSGGPVVIQYQKTLYLAGIIFAEAADINPDFLSQKQSIISKLEKSTVNISGTHLNLILRDAVDTMFKNMSTGIGKAIHAQHISELLSDQSEAFYLIGPEQIPSMGDALVVHGTLKATTGTREALKKKISPHVIDNAITFINSFKDFPEKKAELYASLWGDPCSNVYKFDGGRFDRQSPTPDATNVQIQVGEETVATLVISTKLETKEYNKNPHKVAEVANYVIYQFYCALKHFKKYNEAIVIHINQKI